MKTGGPPGMNRIAKIALFAIAALSIAGFAVVIKRSHLESGFVSAGKTDVNFNITVRGTGGRAVKNARISVFDPEQVVLGITNDNGLLAQKVLVSSGKSLLLQADGIAFKMQRVLLIPRSAAYNATVFFDLAEVHEGNATLLSTENSETTALIKVSTPAPVVVSLELKNNNITADAKVGLQKSINAAALKLGLKTGSRLNCTSLNSSPIVHECELFSDGAAGVFRLVPTLPQSEQIALTWLEDFQNTPEQLNSTKPSRGDFVFNIRHNGQKFRAYLDDKPLNLWKEKTNSSLFRANLTRLLKERKDEIELTIVTEQQLVLQRKISVKDSKRYHTVRLPAAYNFELSRRDGGSSIAR
jgi:hypothetical protein